MVKSRLNIKHKTDHPVKLINREHALEDLASFAPVPTYLGTPAFSEATNSYSCQAAAVCIMQSVFSPDTTPPPPPPPPTPRPTQGCHLWCFCCRVTRRKMKEFRRQSPAVKLQFVLVMMGSSRHRQRAFQASLPRPSADLLGEQNALDFLRFGVEIHEEVGVVHTC